MKVQNTQNDQIWVHKAEPGRTGAHTIPKINCIQGVLISGSEYHKDTGSLGNWLYMYNMMGPSANDLDGRAQLPKFISEWWPDLTFLFLYITDAAREN